LLEVFYFGFIIHLVIFMLALKPSPVNGAHHAGGEQQAALSEAVPSPIRQDMGTGTAHVGVISPSFRTPVKYDRALEDMTVPRCGRMKCLWSAGA
jgi:hypothetical protein